MKKRIGAGLVLLGLLVVAGTAAQVVPMAVSPGSERGVALVGQTCPTFSWTAVDWASGYRVAVFDALGVQIPSYEEMAAGAVPVLSKEIAGRALSWTPSSEEQLSGGSLYVWYVQAADGSGQGTWSKGRLFIVEAGVVASGREGWLRKTLEEKGVREDVISDVLKEMKVEGQGIISGKTDSKPQGKVGALGSEGPNNVLYGTGAGASITSGAYNTFIGIWAGAYTTTGNYNTFLGQNSGSANTTGTDNTFLGFEAGYSNTTASCNTFVGYLAGYQTTTGSNNTFLGFEAGRSGSGSNNVFLGYRAGYSETGSDKLYIANSDTSTPLVYGDFSSGILGLNGWLGVGTQSPNYPIEAQDDGPELGVRPAAIRRRSDEFHERLSGVRPIWDGQRLSGEDPRQQHVEDEPEPGQQPDDGERGFVHRGGSLDGRLEPGAEGEYRRPERCGGGGSAPGACPGEVQLQGGQGGTTRGIHRGRCAGTGRVDGSENDEPDECRGGPDEDRAGAAEDDLGT